MHGRHGTSSTFIRFEYPASTDLATIIPFAAGSTFEGTGPISKGGVFQPVRRRSHVLRHSPDAFGGNRYQATTAPVGTSPIVA